MKAYKKLTEHKGNEYIVTVHISPNCSSETLVALGEMMEHLIKQIEGGKSLSDESFPNERDTDEGFGPVGNHPDH